MSKHNFPPKRILHLTADYPDPLQPAKTKAVFNLLQLADCHTHHVFSLNRVGWRAGIESLAFGDGNGPDHQAVAYGAPPRGLYLVRYLNRLADWIGETCAASGLKPDLIHAHKLTIEGIVAERLAARLGVPLVLSVQGNTDIKIATARRDLRGLYARLWKETPVVFPFAPWARDQLDGLLGQRKGTTTMLPCPGAADDLLRPTIKEDPVILSAFNLKDSANKNAERLIAAVAQAAGEIPDLKLDFIGAGDAHWFSRLSRVAADVAPGRVRFRGLVPNTDIQNCFNAATAFALVSHRESYGMVFAEALLAGTPCLIPRGRAIDGYFPEGSIVLASDPNDQAEMSAALVRLVREQADFKARLSDYGESGKLDILRRPAIRDCYLSGLAALE